MAGLHADLEEDLLLGGAAHPVERLVEEAHHRVDTGQPVEGGEHVVVTVGWRERHGGFLGRPALGQRVGELAHVGHGDGLHPATGPPPRGGPVGRVPRGGPAEEVGADVEGEAVELDGVDPENVQPPELTHERGSDLVAEAVIQLTQGDGVTLRHTGHHRRQPLEPPCFHPLALSSRPLSNRLCGGGLTRNTRVIRCPARRLLF